jgi:hypothetical protein
MPIYNPDNPGKHCLVHPRSSLGERREWYCIVGRHRHDMHLHKLDDRSQRRILPASGSIQRCWYLVGRYGHAVQLYNTHKLRRRYRHLHYYAAVEWDRQLDSGYCEYLPVLYLDIISHSGYMCTCCANRRLAFCPIDCDGLLLGELGR